MLNLSPKENALVMLEQGLSRREISKLLGVSHTSINKWIKTHNPHKSGNLKTGVETPKKSHTGQSKPAKRGVPLLDSVTDNSATPSQTGLPQISTSHLSHEKIDEKTGEILRFYDPLLKWELQATAKEILSHHKAHRICKCCSFIRPDFIKEKKALEIRGGIGKNPYFVGVMVCGLVWLCSVCSVKIQASRALEVRAAIDAHIAQGGSVWMITQTVPHTRFDNLQNMLDRFSKAFHSFKSSRKWRESRERYGISGYIKALEVTWGAEYGWHPHLHTIFFLDKGKKDFSLSAFRSELFEQWRTCTHRNGFDALSPRAFTVQDASKVKDYLNKMTGERYKWGSENELVKLHTKRARGESFAPYDFLRAYNEVPDPLYASLFRDYAEAFYGRMHLTYSKGLKARYRIAEKSDEELALSVSEEDAVLAIIDFTQWRQLRKLPSRRWRGELLDVVKDFGEAGLRHYMEAHNIWSAQA